MSLSSDIITLTPAELAAIVAKAVADALAASSRPKSTSAERMRRKRERDAVTSHIGESDECDVTKRHKASQNVTAPSPPLPPPPLSPKPPIPAPTRTPTPGDNTRVCEGSVFETDPDDSAPPPPNRFPWPPKAAEALQQLYRRRPATPWQPKECTAARRLRLPEPQILADIATFSRARNAGWAYYRRDILTLLNNWQAEIERAEDFLRSVSQPPPKNGNDRATHRPPVTRNPEPLPAGRPSLNATASRGAGPADLAGLGRPSPEGDGKTLW